MREPNRLVSLLYLCAVAIILFFDSPALAQSSNVLKKYDGLRGKEREQQLIEGAKKEGKVVIYSFTAVDQLKPLLDEFQKKYPFIAAEHYRANATGVFNKFAT